MMRGVAQCFFLLLVLHGHCQVRPDSARTSTADQRGAHRFALLIGIDHYRSAAIPTLHGARNDVLAMRGVLIGRYHFPERSVHVLLDSQATYARIIDEFNSFLARSVQEKDDIVVVHFSGHGSRYPDPTSPSGFAETIVPYDSRDPRNLDLTSKALSSLLQELAQTTKNITIILDSCNSGRMVKTRTISATRVRSIPPAKTPPPLPPFPSEQPRSLGRWQAQLAPLDDSYVLLTAALAREEAKEYLVGTNQFGVFSYFLTHELQRAPTDATYLDVMNPVRVRVTQRVENQNPQLLGPNQNHVVFGANIADTWPYLVVVPSPSQDGKVTLPYAGEPHGVTLGSTYDVYNGDEEKFGTAAEPIAQIEIDAVGPFSSEAKIISGGPIAGYSRAVLRDFKLTGRKLKVWIQDVPTSHALQLIASRVGRFSQVELTRDSDAANILILERDRHVTISTADGNDFAISLASSDPDIDRKIGDQVLKWATWFYMLAVENQGSNLNVELSVAPQAMPGPNQNTGPGAQAGGFDRVFLSGDKATLAVTNRSARTLYVTVLVLSSDRTISVVLPDSGEQGAAVELKPGGSVSLADLAAFLPSCLKTTKDTFKTIATSAPIDLHPFEQNKSVCNDMAGRGARDLEDLIHTPNLITRGWITGSPGVWTSVQRVVEVRDKGSSQE